MLGLLNWSKMPIKLKTKTISQLSDGVDVIYLEGQNQAGKEDPHAWLNLENGILYAKNIAKQLIAKDPKNKDFYEKNLAAYTEKLSKLDQEAKQKFNNIPEEKKMIVTSEGCFKYFSKAYGVPSAYIWEINTEEEGTPEQIKTLVEKLRQTKVPALFVESSVDERPMKTVSKDTNIPIYAKIFTDSIAKEGEKGDSYYSMMKWNLDKIAEGLSQIRFQTDQISQTNQWPLLRSLRYNENKKGVFVMATFLGNPVTFTGSQLQVGEIAHDFSLITPALEKKSLADFAGKKKVLSIIPSIDTGICSMQTRHFNQDLIGLWKTLSS